MVIHKITLTYNLADGNLTSDVKTKSISRGDALEFASNTLDPVRVLMIPGEKFSGGEFRTGDDPVIVYTADPFRFCCGVTIGGIVFGYPLHRRFGGDGVVIPAGELPK